MTKIPARASPAAPTAVAVAIVARAPKVATMWPDAVSPRIEPAARPKINQPMSAVDAPSTSRTAGTRATQLAMPSPDSPKIDEEGVAPRGDLPVREAAGIDAWLAADS